ncbi:SRPBCC family protein [Adhaeribacter radiodurans]|uniref:SRPBCC family protein n=1 Tax=Adhaeribacter radiodurans TaxID=2745197 RepID=A0A7L7L877_9BACT|nr:SRPBCC family protein [Adhaeribacter radiodurans]QMU29016.1 SRPBCC family protein [Adhaeribacter radiodurans]
MNIFLIIAIALVGLVALLLIAALFVEKQYTVEREISINRPKAEVFTFLKHLKNQDYYSKWVQTDPNMKKEFRGTDGTVGFVYAWEGNDKAGKGEQEIKNILEGEKLDVEVRFIRPFAAIAQTPFTTQAIGSDQTKVTWGMTGSNAYPMNLMHLFLRGMLGKDLEISLQALKNILENENQINYSSSQNNNQRSASLELPVN